MIADGAPVVVVANDDAQVEETVMRLARVGIESVRGFLMDGITAWTEAGFETAKIEQISVGEMNRRLTETEGLHFVDVRRAGEFETGRAPRAVNLTLSDLHKLTGRLDSALSFY